MSGRPDLAPYPMSNGAWVPWRVYERDRREDREDRARMEAAIFDRFDRLEAEIHKLQVHEARHAGWDEYDREQEQLRGARRWSLVVLALGALLTGATSLAVSLTHLP